jgi:sucrose phosphorylase
MKNQVQLITYVDRLSGGGFTRLNSLLKGPLSDIFGGAHLLPFFIPIDGADAGFDPVDHTMVDTKLGTWEDVYELGDTVELVADLIVNHVSSSSPQFLDYSKNGEASEYAGMFLTIDRVFPDGATESDILSIYRPRPTVPFSPLMLLNGEKRLFWTTFNPEQIDIDVHHPKARNYLDSILQKFHTAGVKMIRLDAVGYAIKKPGTSCFMIPETFDFISELTNEAHNLGIEVLVEIHSHYLKQIEIAKKVDWVYDFALPPLVLHAIFNADSQPLAKWLSISPRNAITVLDTHDGIGVIDAGADDIDGTPGLLAPEEIDNLVETIHIKSNGQSKKATGAAANNLDLYQVNCTYLDALGGGEAEYLIARAIQFFAPGIPQIYYTGLMGGRNDMALLEKTKVGRDINRHYYTDDEIESSLELPLVQKLIELIRLRNSHPAFNGEFYIEAPEDNLLEMRWEENKHWIMLNVDLYSIIAVITGSGLKEEIRYLG